MAEYVVAWTEVLAYFKECRERAIMDLGDAEDTRAIGKAQGKVELCNELLNLQAVFATLAEAQKEKEPSAPDSRALSREVYRQHLQGK